MNDPAVNDPAVNDPAVSEATAAAPARRTLLFMPCSHLARMGHGAAIWRDIGFTGFVAMIDDGGSSTWLYNPNMKPQTLMDRAKALRDTVGNLEIFLGHYCTNNSGPGKFLMPWDDDAAWGVFLRNLEALSRAAVSIRAAGVLMDAEWYKAIGHAQDPTIAWTGHARVAERATQYAHALRSAGRLTLGNYVSRVIEIKLAGYLPFWKAVEQAAPATLMLPEDFYTYSDMQYSKRRAEIKKSIGPRAEMLGSVGLYHDILVTGGFARGVKYARAGSPKGTWIYDWSYHSFDDPAAPDIQLIKRALRGRA